MIPLTPSQVSQLLTDACVQIEQSHNNAWIDISRNNIARRQWEPRFVAYLCGAMVDVAKCWRPTLQVVDPSLRLSVSAVFTHQTPCVKWQTGRCELADLLIAFIDRTKSSPTGAAILVQAKQSDTGTVTLIKKYEKTQFDLLSRRPVFDVDQKSAPCAVNIGGNTPDVALLYGLTPPDTNTPSRPSWPTHRWNTGNQLATVTPAYNVHAGTCLADTLVDILEGNQGWAFALPPTGKNWTHFSVPANRDDWSMLINFLLEKTFSTPLTSLQHAIRGPDRGAEYPLYFQGQTPGGNTMFLLVSIPLDIGDSIPLSWILRNPVQDTGWFQATNSPLAELGGGRVGGGGTGDGDTDEPASENGPISAIVFEFIGKKRGESSQ